MHKKLSQDIAFSLLWLCGIMAVVCLLIVIGYTLIEGLKGISWEFLTTNPAPGSSGGGGIASIILSTAMLAGIAMSITIPLGIFAAIYLSEYAQANKITSAIRYSIETLAGIPSIIFGVFGFLVLVVMIGFGMSILAAGITIAILLLPFMIRTVEEALKAVPQHSREAALALGATKWQTIWGTVLPTALAGILTAIILCIARLLGETAPLFLTMGGLAGPPSSWMDGGRSLAMHIYYSVVELGNTGQAFATATVLIVVILIFSLITNVISTYSRKKLGISRY